MHRVTLGNLIFLNGPADYLSYLKNSSVSMS